MSLKEALNSVPSESDSSGSASTENLYTYPNMSANCAIFTKNTHDEALEKARWQSAVRDAKKRGLDRSKQKKTVRELPQHFFRKSRRHPVKHAQVLLNETSLRFFEIAQITGLNVYQVVTIKLQLREAA